MNSGRIMVVDDEPQIRRVMRTALVANGYEAFEARNGEEALEMLREYNPDLILLDINMPGMGGMSACREIRKVSDAAIIVLSVREGENDKIKALDAGADDYITKPFSVNELMARIRANLRRLPTLSDQTAPIVISNELTVDLSRRQVIARGQPVGSRRKNSTYCSILYRTPISRSLIESCCKPFGDPTMAMKSNISGCSSASCVRRSKRILLGPATF